MTLVTAAPRTRSTVLPYLPFVAVAVLHLVVKAAGWDQLDSASKFLLMPALAIPVVAVGRRGRVLPVALLLVGVLFSWLGDITLTTFVVGLAFFLLGHLAYAAMFVTTFRRRMSWWSLLYLLWFAALLLALAPILDAMLVPVTAYGAVLVVMAATATRGTALTSIGAALFVVSDSLLAVRLFTSQLQGVAEDVVIMALYLAAQLLIVRGMLGRRKPS